MREVSQQWRASSRAASRCFMFMCILLPHWGPATWRSRAQTSMRGGAAVRKTAHHTGTAANLPVEPFNNNAVIHLLGGSFQLHRAQLLHHGFGFLPGSFLALLGVDRLEHLCQQLYLGARRCREDVAVMVCRDFILPEGCKLCPFLFAKLILPDPRSWPFGLPIDFITESRWKAWF